MTTQNRIIVLISFLAFSCGDGSDSQIELQGAELGNSGATDDFVNTIATRITDLGGGTDLLTNYAEYEQLKRSSEDQFFEKQLKRIVEYSPNSGIRDQEKKRSLSDFDSTNVTLCRRPSSEGYLGPEDQEESFGFCYANDFSSMGSEDFVRYLSYTLKAENSSDPIRQITSVRLNKKIRLIFEEGAPLYHVILGERQRGDPIETNPESAVKPEPKPEPKQETTPEPEPTPEPEVLPNLDNLVTSYLDLQEGSNIEAIMRLYDERVGYNDKGSVSKSTIRRDKLSYFQRWPTRNHQRISDVTVKKGSAPGTHKARFNYSYDLRDAKNNSADGKVWMELTVKESNGAYVITKERGGTL